MSDTKARGSVVYKLLILVLTVVLVSSILYPKKVTEMEEKHIQLSHYRMEEIYKAGLQYQKYNGVYTDSLDKIFDFIRNDPRYANYVDSVVIGGLDSIVTVLNEFKARQAFIRNNIGNATDSLMIDSLTSMQNNIKLESRQLAGFVEYVHDRMKNLPNMPMQRLKAAFVIIDSKQFTLNMDIVRNSISNGRLEDATVACNEVINVMDSVVKQVQGVIAHVPDYKGPSLEQLAYCPDTHKQFILTHVDTSVIKYLNIYSPIDEQDIAKVESDFLKSKIGGLELKNHGKIEGNEKSWEEGE